MERVEVTPVNRPIRGVAPGEPLEVTIREAKILVAIKRAAYYVKPEPEPEPPPRRRRRRRHVEEDEPERTYTRRDMVAEND